MIGASSSDWTSRLVSGSEALRSSTIRKGLARSWRPGGEQGIVRRHGAPANQDGIDSAA